MSGYVQGAGTLADGQSAFNAQTFHIQAMINRISTAEPVRVVGVRPGGVGPVGVVSVQPLVNLVDGEGKGHAQGTLFNLPYARVQGGENAVICDPKPGDVGLAVYAMRDTEAVKQGRGRAPANPGSARAYNRGDGFYVGGFLNVAPKRYVMIDDAGITLDDGAGGRIELKNGLLTITAPAGIQTASPFNHNDTPDFVMGGDGATGTVNGNLRVNGHIDSAGDQTAGGISQMHHTHTGVQPGSASTGEPQ